MIRRSSREYIINLINENPDWNVLDLASGADGFKVAKVFADIVDYKEYYPDNRFVQTEASETPFEDGEFDFVIATHIAEHVVDPIKFCKEMARISKRGYLETPLPFFDNIVLGNSNPLPHGHAWWVTFDDDRHGIVFKPRVSLVEEMITPFQNGSLAPFFNDSMVTRLYWESSFRIFMEDPVFSHIQGNSTSKTVIDLRGQDLQKLYKWKLGRTVSVLLPSDFKDWELQWKK